MCIRDRLFELLRAKRAELARRKRVPAYIIFGDKTLIDMAQSKPITLEQFSAVFGVGAAKQKAYGEIFLGVIREYMGKFN